MNVKTIAAVIALITCAAIFALVGYRFGADRPTPTAVKVEPDDLPAPCKLTTFEHVDHVVCTIDLRTYDVGVHLAGADGKAYGSLDAFHKATMVPGRQPLLAMNAGMYHEGLVPVGLLVEDGREIAPVAAGEGEGNFFLKPNGIFLIDTGGRAAVMETSGFLAAHPAVKFATQSGPMLVIGGHLHPRFLPDGTSRYVRNGVGVRDSNTVVLAISLSPVSLGSFGRLFRDGLECPNALFLDGAISALSNGDKTLIGGGHPAGPILAVWPKG